VDVGATEGRWRPGPRAAARSGGQAAPRVALDGRALAQVAEKDFDGAAEDGWSPATARFV
jgi:hypothetical protein